MIRRFARAFNNDPIEAIAIVASGAFAAFIVISIVRAIL